MGKTYEPFTYWSCVYNPVDGDLSGQCLLELLPRDMDHLISHVALDNCHKVLHVVSGGCDRMGVAVTHVHNTMWSYLKANSSRICSGLSVPRPSPTTAEHLTSVESSSHQSRAPHISRE